MKPALLAVSLVFAVAVSVCSASEPNAIRNKLEHDKTIQGVPCAKGDAWFYPDGALNQCALSRNATIGDILAPHHSVIELWPTGAPHLLRISHNATVGGYRVMGSPRTGFPADVVTTFYPSGKLRSIYLVSDQTIQGVPCRGGGAWKLLAESASDNNSIEFFNNGRLEACRLARDYAGHTRGQRLFLPYLTAAAEIDRSEPAQ
jgi:hypothetical protein